MPISEELLEILCCPKSKTPVQLLSEEALKKFNEAVAAGTLVYEDGSQVEKPLQEALITTDGKTLYRIDDDIPVMLVERAIAADQV
jgi:uncharacterized protein YbaR (Trm112 family)